MRGDIIVLTAAWNMVDPRGVMQGLLFFIHWVKGVCLNAFSCLI